MNTFIPAKLDAKLTPAQLKAYGKLIHTLKDNPVAAWQFGHGYVSEKPKAKHAALATGLKEDECKRHLGAVSALLNECTQSGLMTGNVTAARATLTGKLNATVSDTIMGGAMKQAMELLIASAVESITAGKAPVMLLVPVTMKSDTEATPGFKYDFRLTRMALQIVGVDTNGLKSEAIPALVAGAVESNQEGEKIKARARARKNRNAKPVPTPENVTPITEGQAEVTAEVKAA